MNNLVQKLCVKIVTVVVIITGTAIYELYQGSNTTNPGRNIMNIFEEEEEYAMEWMNITQRQRRRDENNEIKEDNGEDYWEEYGHYYDSE